MKPEGRGGVGLQESRPSDLHVLWIKGCRDILAILGISLTALILLEFGIRGYFLAQLGWDEYLKYEYRHDPVFAVTGDRELNSLGFRGKEFSVHKPSGVYRLVTIGGSEVFGVYVSLEDSLPVLLEQKLKVAFPEKSFEVINAGRLGSVAANEALLMEQLVNLHPDHILVFNGWNDIYHSRYLPEQYEKVMRDTKRKFQWNKKLSRWMRRHLWTLRKIREWRDRLRRKLKSGARGTQKPSAEEQWRAQLEETEKTIESPGEPWISFGWSGGYVHYPMSRLREPSSVFAKDYYENLVRIASIGKRHDMGMTFIFQPDLAYHKLHRPLNVEEETAFEISTRRFSRDWYLTVEKLYPVGIEMMRRAGVQEGIPFYDFSLIFKDAKENGFGDTVHLNAFGNRVVADELVKILRPALATSEA